MRHSIAGSSFCQSTFGAGHFEAVVFARYPHPDPENHDHPSQVVQMKHVMTFRERYNLMDCRT
jgi:hypothetical protein